MILLESVRISREGITARIGEVQEDPLTGKKVIVYEEVPATEQVAQWLLTVIQRPVQRTSRVEAEPISHSLVAEDPDPYRIKKASPAAMEAREAASRLSSWSDEDGVGSA